MSPRSASRSSRCSLYFKDGRAKVELGLGKGRQKADKRQAIAERDSKREIERGHRPAQQGHVTDYR